jgi:VanZ family protein
MRQLAWTGLWWVIGLAMVSVVLWGTLIPPAMVPHLHLNDKVEHFLAHFGLALWFSGLVLRSNYPWLALVLVAFGGGIEIAQGVMGLGRDADWHDWYADCVGVAAGVALAYLGLGAWAVKLERSVGLGRAARPRLK